MKEKQLNEEAARKCLFNSEELKVVQRKKEDAFQMLHKQERVENEQSAEQKAT
jgi:hypothetical protein